VSASSQHLTLFEDRCDQCGACRAACPHNAIKTGAAFIYVDWRKCEGCLKCVEACKRNAIVSRVVPLRSSSATSTVPLAEVSKVVVGSRAEAKAVRRAAERAAKDKPSTKPSKQVAGAKASAKKPALRTASDSAAQAHVPPAKRSAEKPACDIVGSGSPVAWTLLDAFMVLAVMLLALIVKNAVLALPQVALMPQLGKMVVRTVVLSAFYITQIAAFGWLAGRHGLPAPEAFGLRRGTAAGTAEPTSAIGSAGLVLALLLGCEIVSISYGLAMDAAGFVQPARLSTDLTKVFGAGPVGLAIAFVLVAVAAPFAEEIAFRGILLPAVGDRWGMWVGIGVSAVLYAAYHANLWLFAPTVVLGVALGWLAWTRRSLWPAVALHVLYNAAAVAAAFATAK